MQRQSLNFMLTALFFARKTSNVIVEKQDIFEHANIKAPSVY